MEQVVLVTGASTGLGRRIASCLACHGFQVYGTSRYPKAGTLDGFQMVALDVTDDDSVQACIDEILKRAGRIDILINNAGVELMGASEETSIEEAKALFETNFFGVMRMVNAALPTMRKQKHGHIINISSSAGLGGAPFQTMYSASKHAIEGYTDALWYELEPLNIRVSLVEPGYYKSEINQRKHIAQNPIGDYHQHRQRAISGFEYRLENGPDPAPVAEAILRIVQGRSRKLRNPVGVENYAYEIKNLVPDWIVRKRIRWMAGIDDAFSDATRALPNMVWMMLFGLVAIVAHFRKQD